MVNNVTIFGIDMVINPIAFTIKIGSFQWNIYWYGIMIALGFALAIIYGMKNAKRFGLDFDRLIDVILVVVPVAILCARTYYVIFDGEKLTGIKDFFGLGDSQGFSGLAIYGGVIGAFASGALMCYIRKVKILDAFDLAAMGFIIGQAVGRWGNFFNQEAFGGPTGSNWWGMTSENVVTDFIRKGFDPTALAHPCFLYESVWCIIGFFVLHKLSKKRQYSGQVALLYAVWYGFGRAIIEQFRTDSLMIGPFRVSALLSLTIVILSVAALIVIDKKVVKKTTVDYVPQFEEQIEGEEGNVEDN